MTNLGYAVQAQAAENSLRAALALLSEASSMRTKTLRRQKLEQAEDCAKAALAHIQFAIWR